jgi:hypothetical protein
MRSPRVALALVLVLASAAAGCTARGQDPFAYTKKPLFASTFHLAGTDAGDRQSFFVEDGSIGRIAAQVWLNVTSGAARVEFVDPSGRTVWITDASASGPLPVELGAWQVRVTPTQPETLGSVGVLVTR